MSLLTPSRPAERLASRANPSRQNASTAPAERGHLARFSLRDAPGWIISLCVHLVAILPLLVLKIHTETPEDLSILSTLEDIQNELVFDSTIIDQAGTTAEVTSLTMSAAGLASVTVQSAEAVQEEVQQKVDEEFQAPNVELTDEVAPPADEALVSMLDDITGGVVENVAQGGGGVEGAIDRLTWEITQSLREQKTTVIWLFDRSLSLKERRNAIADRFENVYRQLESLGEGGQGALTTVAATYGKDFSLLTDKPLEDVRPLISKVRAIPNDESGIENVFGAVHQLAKKFRGERARGRNLRLFIITDEKGDDAEKYLEECILLCRRAGMKAYVVGNAAPFGREKGYVKWTYPDGFVSDEEVDAGPETLEPEALAIDFWENRGPDLRRMSSGYGPYGLTRLCKETGGMYFIAQEDDKGKRFPAAVMRNYAPDYRAMRDYQTSVSKNKAKLLLVTAAKATKLEGVSLPQLGFAAYNDTVLREQTTEAQKPAAELEHKVNRIVELLAQGEKEREKIAEPRWRAAFDLAIGRALAMKVRAFGYNQMLADMKNSPKPFQNKNSNEWRIVPSRTINTAQPVKKLEKQASTYLKRVIDEHPETPWAYLAERELATPMGWDWKEVHNPGLFPPNTSQEEARRQIMLAQERARERAKKQPPPPARERPKL